MLRNYININTVFKAVFEQSKNSLDFIVSHLFRTLPILTSLASKNLCKYNQTSNWEKRPLRKAQINYAALDAFILLKILQEIENNQNYEEEIMYLDTL